MPSQFTQNPSFSISDHPSICSGSSTSTIPQRMPDHPGLSSLRSLLDGFYQNPQLFLMFSLIWYFTHWPTYSTSWLKLPTCPVCNQSWSWSLSPLGNSHCSGPSFYVCNAGNQGSIPSSGRSPGEGNGNPLQYSCLENPMDRGTWKSTVHSVTKNQTQLND